MRLILKPCLDCGEPCRHSRCRDCSKGRERTRNADPKRKGYRDPLYLAQPMEGICAVCGKMIEPGKGSRGHIVPLSLDRTSIATLPEHRSCNSAKGNR